MKVHVFVSETWDEPSTLDEVRARARAAEQAGLAGGWVPYLPWSLDALSSVQAAGEVTERIELGTAVIPTYLFHPLAMARQAATVQAAVGRPITLGIGCSNVAVIEMHGLRYERPARHVEEYLQVLRLAASAKNGTLAYQGEIFRPQGLYSTPDAAVTSLLVGALGPRMLRVAGAHSDGTITTWCGPLAIERAIVPDLTAAARESGRRDPRIAAVLPVCVTGDPAAARARAAEKFAVYDRIPRYRRMLELGGVEHAAELCVIGSVHDVREALRRFAGAGVTDLIVGPFRGGDARDKSWRHTLDGLAEVAGDL